MRKMVLFLLLSFVVVTGCGNNDEAKSESGTNGELVFELAHFDISLPNEEGEFVNITPTGKTIYAYFTGIQ